MPAIGAYHLATARPGQMAEVNGKPCTGLDRPRGTITVDHDGSRYFYRRPHGRTVREVRAMIDAAFCRVDQRLRGAWPEYRVE